ncbi:MAG: EamA family transporter RarD [Deltaproteobacteria bacterium]|jgi:chloramphenicol-sensitive protein RarD|nr:EamA family transporter RarD [Deltaproteobacteria bacterium]
MNKNSGGNCSALLITVTCNTFCGLLPLYWRMLQNVPTVQIVCQRLFWSCLVLGIVLVCRQKIKTLALIFKNKKSMASLALCSLLLASNWLLYLSLINSGQLLQASFGIYLYPLLTLTLSILFLQDRVSLTRLMAVILALAAIFCQIVTNGGLPWAAVLLALCTAAYSLLRAMLSVDIIAGFFLETLLAVPFAVFFLFFWQANGTLIFAQAQLSESLSTALLLAGSGVVTVIPLAFMFRSMQNLKISSINLIQLIVPSLIFLLGLLAVKEPLIQGLFTSFVLLWAGLALYNLDGIKRDKLLVKLRKIPDHHKTYE